MNLRTVYEGVRAISFHGTACGNEPPLLKGLVVAWNIYNGHDESENWSLLLSVMVWFLCGAKIVGYQHALTIPTAFCVYDNRLRNWERKPKVMEQLASF